MGFQGNLLLTRICSPTQAPSCQFCVGPGQGPGSCASCSAPGPCDSARPVQEVLGAGGDAVCSLWQRPEVHRRAGPGGLEQSPAPRQNTAPSQKQLSANAGPSWRPNAEPAEFPCGLSRLSSRGPSGWPDRNAGRARQHCALAWSGARSGLRSPEGQAGLIRKCPNAMLSAAPLPASSSGFRGSPCVPLISHFVSANPR